MSAVIAIATVELRRFLRDKSNIFFVFVFPLMLILLLGSQFGAGSGQARVTISGPASELSRALTAELQSAGVAVSTTGADAARSDLSRGRTDVGVFLDNSDAAAFDAGRPTELDVVMASQSSALTVMQQVRTAVLAAGLERSQLAALTGAGIPAERARTALDQAAVQIAAPTAEIVNTNDVAQEFRGLGRFDLGASQQLLLFVFLSSLTGAATLIQARRFGVVGRVMSAPVSSGQIVAGQALGRFAIASVQGGFIMAGTALLFGVDWGNLWLSALVLVIFCAVSAAAAMTVGSVMDNDTAAAGVGVGGGLVLGGLGGCMVPPEFFPEALAAVSFATPHRWAYEAFAAIQRRDGTLADILPQLGVLAGMAAALLLLGTWLLRRSLNRAL
ncbi:ABC transporter permease [Arthrobacter sp. AL08]|uniref:ABC transporter permease n=1 Tax=unclassified Arthrobacter TaxID=235627 RepID=UPI00249B065F|nr:MULTISPECIES: ABC transporter permease [unclassified Arthrobacter]MDI3241984.1 ABC transporter permease [Arthrobacter sp. AL05]MDI3278076.1 ABC transporter permease [Arthrobacter sp. AL08]